MTQSTTQPNTIAPTPTYPVWRTGGRSGFGGRGDGTVKIPAAQSAPLLCWILISAIHYHDGRFRALAARGGFRLAMIELAETHGFRSLRPSSPTEDYGSYTLFSGTSWGEIDRPAMVRRLHETLTALRPSVVCINGWSSGGGIASLTWCLRHRIPVVLMSESAENDEPRRWWKEAVKRRIVRLCSAALVGGSKHGEYIAKLGLASDRIFDGYDVVDNRHFEAGAAAARLASSRLRLELGLPAQYFLACSRFETKKNLARLLEAYCLYRKRTPEKYWGLVVVGDGVLRTELESLRGTLGLNSDVLFPGFKSYDDLPAYYGLAEAFLHVSTTEQWGLVINEAMAAGLPVVVSDRCGCAGELLKGGVNGFVVDPYDVAGLAETMSRVASRSCDRERMGQASRDIVFSWSPDRFARHLVAAAEAGVKAARPRPDPIDRLLLWLLKTR
jgi:glycosyltransferase involved in cell wall biosynthesis